MLYPKNRDSSLSPELFRHPTSEYRGAPFWAWNNKLDKDTLTGQIDMMRDMGMGGFHMHSRVGLATPYMGEEFLSMIRVCNEKARENGMLSWLYDEDRWPSGAAGGRVTKDHRYRSRFLLLSPNHPMEGVAADRDTYEKSLMSGAPLKGYWLASYSVNLRDGHLDGYRRCGAEDGLFGLPATGTRRWHAYLCVEEDNAWYNGQAYANTLDPAAIGRFIEETHEKYLEAVGPEFGASIPAIFTDEPQFRHKEAFRFADEVRDVVIPFTDDFPDTYRAAYGTEIMDHLPELFWELPNGEVSVERYRYHDHLAERFSQAFADQIGSWCENHGIMLTGHMMAEQSLESQTGALGEAMRSYRSFQLPGIDMLTDDREFSTAKQAQSASNQFGRPGVLSELYGVTNWDFPFKGHKLQGDWQAALGVSVRVHHLTWMSMEGEAKRDYPASIGYQSPWHTEYAMVEDYFGRLNTALTRGRPHVRIAAIHPVESYWLHWGPFEQTFPARDELETNFTNLLKWLLTGQMDFDLISESLLPGQCPLGGKKYTEKNSEKTGEVFLTGATGSAWEDPAGGMSFPVGEMRYDVILVPGNHTLRGTTLERLEAFRKAGGSVIFAGTPAKWVDAVPDDRAKKLAETCSRIPFTRTALMDALLPWREVSVWTEAGIRHDNLMTRIRQDGDARWVFLCHAYDKMIKTDWTGNVGLTEKVEVRLAGVWDLTCHDAMTGEIRNLPAIVKNGETCFTSELSIHDSLLLHLMPRTVSAQEIPEISTQGKPMGHEGLPALAANAGSSTRICVELEDPVPITLSEPNVLLLDMAEFRLDGGEWEPVEEILRIDTRLRTRLGWPLRMEAMIQPWVLLESASEAPCHKVSLRFAFRTDCALAETALGVEHPEEMRIVLDGKPVDQRDMGWFTDTCIRKIALPALSAGNHVIELEVPFGHKDGIEWAYLLGDFGVRVDGRHKRIIEPVRTLAFGDWTTQGLPFYAGNVTYHCSLKTHGGAVSLAATQFPNPVLSVAVDGKPAGRIAFAPYSLDLGTLTAGTHEVAVTAFGNRFNAFGCVHLCNPRFTWFGTPAWRTEGLSWSYQYQLKPMGLLVAPTVTETGDCVQ